MLLRDQAFLIIFNIAFLIPTSHANKDLPFVPGERLEYDLSWGLIPVGSAFMEVGPRNLDSQEPWVINFSVKTNKFADKIYKVRTNVRSWINSDFTHSLKYMKSQQEGKTRKEIKVEYDYKKKIVRYSENNLDPRVLPLGKKVYDPLAIAFAYRTFPTDAGKTKILPTCDGKKFLDVRVNVGKRELVKVPFGVFRGNDVTPDIKDLSGVFKKSPKGILRVWYSSDNRRLPLKISSKVVVGSFTAKLKNGSNLQQKLN